ncbi:MAG TPA: PAS domain S-box protein [Spirochaetia bacterium]
MSSSRERKTLSPPTRIALIYAVFSALWIFLSDSLVGLLVHDPALMTRMSVIKGLAFIAVTAALLFVLTLRATREAATMSRELASSDERFRILFTNLTEGYARCELVSDESGKVIDLVVTEVNPAFGRLTGLSDVLGRRISELLPGLLEESPGFLENCIRMAGGGPPERFEMRPTALGRWYAVSVYSNEPGRFTAIFDDVTQRKNSERARDATLELLRICNRAATVRELMQELTGYFKRLTGCSAVGVRLQQGDDYPYYETRGFPPDFVRLESSLCARDVEGKIVRDAEGSPLIECMCGNVIRGRFDPSLPFFTENGSFWSSHTSRLLATTTEEDRQAPTRNRCNGMGYETVVLIPLRTQRRNFGLIQFNDERVDHLSREDVAELEGLVMYVAIALAKLVTEDALSEASRFNQQIIDSVGQGIIVLDTDLRYTLWNPFMERLTGLPACEILGKRTREVFPLFHSDAVKNQVLRALQGLPTTSNDIEFHIPSTGRRGWTTVSHVPLRNTQGQIVGVIGTVHDITERQEAAERLRETNERLVHAEKMEAVGRLAGGVAHDFNNILTAIYGYCDILRAGMAEGSAERGYIEEVRSSAGRAASLTQQLLAFSRRQTLQPRVVDLNELLGNLRRMLERMIGEDIEVRLELADELWRVRVDPARIEQVVMNLAVNSRDAMPKGGRLTIATRNEVIDEELARRNSDLSAGEHVCLAVTDTGVGMNEETLSHLFEPFFTTKEMGKGTGLGLSTVYGIVRQSGGGVIVESSPDRGATFRVFIPRAGGGEDGARAETTAARTIGGRERILLVEDDEEVRGLVTLVLRNHGYTVLAAADGEEALRIARADRSRIDLLITDIVMPGMGGRALVETLRVERPDVKVAFMSGYTNDMVAYQDVVREGLELIEKPVDPPELLRRIRGLLDGRASGIS